LSDFYCINVKAIVTLFILLLCQGQPYSQKASSKDSVTIEEHRINFLELGLEYYSPSHWNRQIKTININGLVGKEFIPVIGLQIFAGVTITHAWGNTIMVNEFLKEEQYETSAMGIGPISLLRLQPLAVGNFSVSIDALGGIILYNKSFPPRGDIYNFMFRLGGTITFYIGNNLSFNLGLRRMHISNGQGVGPFNPFYEGEGLSLNLSKQF
jgi:lipid A 3-O-deacylase